MYTGRRVGLKGGGNDTIWLGGSRNGLLITLLVNSIEDRPKETGRGCGRKKSSVDLTTKMLHPVQYTMKFEPLICLKFYFRVKYSFGSRHLPNVWTITSDRKKWVGLGKTGVKRVSPSEERSERPVEDAPGKIGVYG